MLVLRANRDKVLGELDVRVQPGHGGLQCGLPWHGATPWQQPLSLPANGVIYVENVPTPLPGNGTCTDTPSWAEFNDGPPASNDPDGTGTCLGNAFVEGTVDGQVTVAADNNIYVVAQPSDASATTVGAQSEEGGDVVGLVAGNDVFVNHDTNVANDGGCAPAEIGDDCFGPLAFAPIVQNPTINAVVFAMTGSLDTTYFWGGGTMGNMTINGAIVGNFMDCEGVFSGSGGLVDGYNEIYNWDSRLPHLSPPFFIPPNAPSWMETTYSELPALNG